VPAGGAPVSKRRQSSAYKCAPRTRLAPRCSAVASSTSGLVNLSSGVIASVMCVLVFVLSKGTLASFFAVMLALTVSTTALSYCLSSRRWSSCAASIPAPADRTGCPEARQARGSR